MPLSWNEIRHRTIAFIPDPLTMPAPLLKAHQQLDRAAHRCYRPEPFASDRHRVEYLFALYEQLWRGLLRATMGQSDPRLTLDHHSLSL